MQSKVKEVCQTIIQSGCSYDEEEWHDAASDLLDGVTHEDNGAAGVSAVLLRFVYSSQMF